MTFIKGYDHYELKWAKKQKPEEHDINRTIIQMTKWGISFTYLSEINKLIRPKYLERI